MKKRLISCLIALSFCLMLCPSKNALAQDSSPIIQQSIDPGVALLCFLLLILVVLALWLLKSSGRLKMMDQIEPDGPDWITKHLNDLETQQLDKLITRNKPAMGDNAKNDQKNSSI